MAIAEVKISVVDTEQMRVALEALAVIAQGEHSLPAALVAEDALVEIMQRGTRIAV